MNLVGGPPPARRWRWWPHRRVGVIVPRSPATLRGWRAANARSGWTVRRGRSGWCRPCRAGRAGLVEIAQIHSGTGRDGTSMERRLGPGALGSEGRAAWRLSADVSRNLVRGEAGVSKGCRMNASDGEPRTGGRVCGLGAAWIDRWVVGERGGGRGFDSISPPNGAPVVERTRRLRWSAGRRRGRLSGRQEGLKVRQVAPVKAFDFVVRFVVRVC